MQDQRLNGLVNVLCQPSKGKRMNHNNVVTAEDLIIALWLAVYAGDFAECKKLVDQGVYVDAKDENGNSPLMEAVSNPKCAKIARLLIKTGALVNGTNCKGETPLVHAAASGNEAVVSSLLKAGAEPNSQTRDGLTALMVSAEKGHGKIVKLLLAHGADPNVSDRNGATAIMKSAEQGHHAIVKLLADHGAVVNTQDLNGETALMIAAFMGNRDIVKTLLAKGADRVQRSGSGYTALDYAAGEAHAEVIALFQPRPKRRGASRRTDREAPVIALSV